MTPEEFLPRALAAAITANHIFPEMAACEAALESSWGESKLARLANNLFGQKHGKEPFPTISMNTQEYVEGTQSWVWVPAAWPVFPDWETSFLERMALLNRKPDYAAALAARNEDEYIEKVSKVWATDPDRAQKVDRLDHKYECVMIRSFFHTPTVAEALASVPRPALPDGLK